MRFDKESTFGSLQDDKARHLLFLELLPEADRGSAEVEHWTSDLRVPGSIPAWGETGCGCR